MILTQGGMTIDRSPVPPQGTVVLRQLGEDPGQLYFLYRPRSMACTTRVFVSIHGISRNAREHAIRFKKLAERYGTVIVAPLFHYSRFPDYQRLGLSGRGLRADLALERIIAEAEQLTGADGRRLLYLFGYSGGGQFVHRYAMLHPERVARVAIGAAGWYTFPDPGRRYPRGLRPRTGLGDLRLIPGEFLSIPACVLVGERDQRLDPELNQSPRINRQQGLTRLERGRRWTEAMRGAARAHGMNTPYSFHVLPGSGHSFTQCMKRGKMGRLIFRFLFDAPCPQEANEAGRMPVLTRLASELS